MDGRILMRFIGERETLSSLYDILMEQFPDAEIPSEDTGDWYQADDNVMDEYECRFEELPETDLLVMEGALVVEGGVPEDAFADLMDQFEKVYGHFKWSSFDVGIECGVSAGWGEFIADTAVDGSDEAYEISEDVLGF